MTASPSSPLLMTKEEKHQRLPICCVGMFFFFFVFLIFFHFLLYSQFNLIFMFYCPSTSQKILLELIFNNHSNSKFKVYVVFTTPAAFECTRSDLKARCGQKQKKNASK